jgi:DNA replication and repair protein RecF
VAAHLDPDRRAALYDEISDLGAQALMTGTEPALFDGLGGRAQRFSVTEDNGLSRISG